MILIIKKIDCQREGEGKKERPEAEGEKIENQGILSNPP